MTIHDIDKKTIYAYLEEIKDPEVPVLSIIDLGIVRDVVMHKNDEVEVFITPTYNGCPAMDMIAMQIRMMLSTLGFKKYKITQVLSPAWTTNWMSEEGKRKLKEYGIAPPQYSSHSVRKATLSGLTMNEIPCPLCNSTSSKLISEFGSTACKALYQCNDCKEPFDYFKCH
jgi:ring-1,2-phenylacetyl-CoA epoxidase subunit PaaD